MAIQPFQPPVGLSQMVGTPAGSQQIATPQVTNLQQDPGYQFRLQEGLRAAQHGQAARGMTQSGTTLRGLAEFGQGLASQEYQNAFQRAMQQGQFAQSEQARGFGERMGQAQFGASEQARGFGERMGARGLQEQLLGGQFGRTMGVEQLQEQLRGGQFGRQLGLAGLGMQAASGMAGLVSPSIPAFGSPAPGQGRFDPTAWATAMDNQATSLGNIGLLTGSGQLGASQAWGRALGDIGQMAGRGDFNWLGNMFGFGGI